MLGRVGEDGKGNRLIGFCCDCRRLWGEVAGSREREQKKKGEEGLSFFSCLEPAKERRREEEERKS